ncbi:hypothetical protein [Saccharopolyspora phatthalungensis]|uniref:Mce-associated membrane protein n=1 Tax=Saccharopolyspora phatthalungensis TaxID=664693 RepID=A0A840Q7P4_9PSEU|nr:hypothetical protein [Saccharopolyspora phatthalungensis]MBB5154728.1 Mce-associated membrane protein [Saccharopolyspora phatthalungensis]
MPSNRRNGPNRQPPTRRPRVAGLRNRTANHGETFKSQAQESGRVTADAVDALDETKPDDVDQPLAAEAVAERSEATGVGAEPVGSDAETEQSASVGPERPSSTAVPETAQPDRAWAQTVRGVHIAELSETKPGRTSAKRRWWALWVATVVLAGFALWFGIETYAVRDTGSAANETLVSAGATSEVNGQISDAVEKVFSYDFNDTAKTETAARDLLVGPAVQRYNDLFALVKQQAPQQQLIVTTTVKSSAVTRLQDDRAELLLFVDQHSMRANTGESNTGPAQISVSAEKQGDRWKITQITLR